jgi:RNA polymerase sigma-70 factor (ECF subfamily)
MSRRPNPENLIPMTAADARRMDALTRSHYPALVQYAYRLTGNATLAEDIAQDALLRACRGFRRYDPARPFRQWLFRIAHNLYVDQVRACKARAPISLDAMIESDFGDAPIAFEIADSKNDPQAIILETTLEERLELAIRALPQEFREAIALCDLHGLSYEEIGASLRCSVGTVRSRIHRGRRLLRKALAADAPRQVYASLMATVPFPVLSFLMNMTEALPMAA